MKKIILATAIVTMFPLAAFAEEIANQPYSAPTPDEAAAASAAATPAVAPPPADEASCASAMATQLIASSAKKDLVLDSVQPKVRFSAEKLKGNYWQQLTTRAKNEYNKVVAKGAKASGVLSGAYDLTAHDASGVKYTGEIFVQLRSNVNPSSRAAESVSCALNAVPVVDPVDSSFELTPEKSDKKALEINADRSGVSSFVIQSK